MFTRSRAAAAQRKKSGNVGRPTPPAHHYRRRHCCRCRRIPPRRPRPRRILKGPEGRRGISGTRQQPPTQPPRAVGATAQRPQKSGSSTSTSLPDAYSHLWVIGRYHRRTTRARWQKRIKTMSTGMARKNQSTSSGAAPEHTEAARSVTKRVRAHVPQSCVSVHASWQSAKCAHVNNGKEHEAVAVRPA